MGLTADELNDFRDDLADANGVFSDAAIQRLYTRAGSYAGAVVLGIDQLLASATKLTKYRQNMSEEDQTGVFDRLLKLRAVKQAEIAATRTQVRIVGMRGVPPPLEDKPGDW